MKILWPTKALHKGDNQPGAVMILSSLLAREGFESTVVEAGAENVLAAVDTSEPVVLAFSTMTANVDDYIALNRQVKARCEVFSVFGGPHPTFFPEMIEEEGVDAVCIGEGEGAIVELAKALSDGRPIDGIQNLHVKTNGRVVKNPVRGLIEDLDSLPLPDHGIFERAIPRSLWRTYVHTSRGCPYLCAYCFNEPLRALYRGKGRWLRRRSVNHVMAELEAIKAGGLYQFIRFTDDLFILNPEWVEEFARRYRAIGIPFSCMARANLVREPIVKCLAEAGCYSMSLGIEAGSNRLRNDILNRSMSKAEIIKACRIIRRNGIKLGTFNIVGIPGGTLAEDFLTLDLNIRVRPDYCVSSMLQPYDRTAIHEYASSRNLLEDVPVTLRAANVNAISAVKFHSAEEKRMVENLHKLFPIIAKLPSLRPLAGWLIKMPLAKAYFWAFSRMLNVYDHVVAIPPRIGLRNLLKRSSLYSWLWE